MGPCAAVSCFSSLRTPSRPAAAGSPSCCATAGNTACGLLSDMQFRTMVLLLASSSCRGWDHYTPSHPLSAPSRSALAPLASPRHLSLPIRSTGTPKTGTPSPHLAVEQDAAQTGCFPRPGGSGDVEAAGPAPADVVPQELPDDAGLLVPGVEPLGHGRMQHPLRLLVAGTCAGDGEGSGGAVAAEGPPSPTTLTFLPEEPGAGRCPTEPRTPGGLLPPVLWGGPRGAGLLRGRRGVPEEQAAALVLLAALGRGAGLGMGDIAEVVVTCGADGSEERPSAQTQPQRSGVRTRDCNSVLLSPGGKKLHAPAPPSPTGAAFPPKSGGATNAAA